MAKINQGDVLANKDICKPVVQVCVDMILVYIEPVQGYSLVYYKGIDNILLEELTSPEQGRGLVVTDMETELVEEALLKADLLIGITYII